LSADDTEWQTRLAAFHHGLQGLGWTVGRNIRIDYRQAPGDSEQLRRHAAELIALAPDVLLATGTPVMTPLQQATRTVPRCSRSSPIRSAPAMSTAWRGRVATPRVL
jgi:putative ABC transport system substrate-binding protein